MPPDMRAIRGVDDSKALTAQERQRLVGRIQERAVAWALGAASVHEIERFNIYQASVLAMRRALGRLSVQPGSRHHRRQGDENASHSPHGDRARRARCFSIACASIIAKVTRDRLMARLALGIRRTRGSETSDTPPALIYVVSIAAASLRITGEAFSA